MVLTKACARIVGAATCLLMLSAVIVARPASAQLFDNFEDGTTQGWHIGPGQGGAPPASTLPVNITTGGPAGAGDNYLQVRALGGNGPGSKLSVMNTDQWTFDYLATGTSAIEMDLNNFGPENLALRLLIVGPFGPTGPTSAALTTNPVLLPAGSGWTHATFAVAPGDWTPLFGSLTEALSTPSELRIFHNPDPTFFGPGGNAIPAVTVTLGIDNIVAAQAPEPGALALLGIGALVGAIPAIRRRCCRRR